MLALFRSIVLVVVVLAGVELEKVRSMCAGVVWFRCSGRSNAGWNRNSER